MHEGQRGVGETQAGCQRSGVTPALVLPGGTLSVFRS
jgi:hypothetical protein